MFDDGEELLQLDGDGNDRAEDDQERPVLLAERDLPGESLDDLGARQEAVAVPNMRED
jgi:hypothetical protein